jgi:hypothetical protein
MRKCLVLLVVVCTMVVSMTVLAVNPDPPPIMQYCDQPQCGCAPPPGYYTCSYTCACSASGQSRTCTFCPGSNW